jgi:hypothetical protein
MNNQPATRVAVIAAFLQIAIQLVFLYIGTDNFGLNIYIRYALSGLSLLVHILVLFFLQGVLKFFNEKNSIVSAFGVYIILSVLYFILNITAGMWIKNLASYYSVVSIVYFILELYLALMSFMVKHPVIRNGFALFAILLLVASIAILALPVLFGLLGLGYNVFRYVYLVNVLPPIAAIIIFNRTAEGAKDTSFTGDKPLFKDDPF